MPRLAMMSTGWSSVVYGRCRNSPLHHGITEFLPNPTSPSGVSLILVGSQPAKISTVRAVKLGSCWVRQPGGSASATQATNQIPDLANSVGRIRLHRNHDSILIGVYRQRHQGICALP